MGCLAVLCVVVVLMLLVKIGNRNYMLARKIKGATIFPIIGTWTVMLKDNGKR